MNVISNRYPFLGKSWLSENILNYNNDALSKNVLTCEFGDLICQSNLANNFNFNHDKVMDIYGTKIDFTLHFQSVSCQKSKHFLQHFPPPHFCLNNLIYRILKKPYMVCIQGVLALCEFHYCKFRYCGFSKLYIKFS